VYCSKCGSEISAAASFCAACGQPVSTLPSLSPPAEIQPSYATPVVPAPYSGGGVVYAGFWLRFVAYLIDSFIGGVGFVILLIPIAVLTGMTSFFGRISSGEDIGNDAAAATIIAFVLGLFAIVLLAHWLYFAWSESSSWQATIGKKMLNLKVTDMQGQPVTFARASGRFFGKIITGMIPLGIGYILAGFTEKKQAVHDMIASCLIVRNE
jgi:uncharacterized RDD family membrane protein YckC